MPGPGTAMGTIAGAPTVIATQLAAVPNAPAMPASSSGPVAVDLSVLGETAAPAVTAPAPVQTALASPRGQPAGVIYFHNGSASLSAKDRAVLRQIARLQRQNGAVIQVVGHASMWTRNTDLQRQASVNQNLSVVRASAVARTLRQFGVSSGRIQTAAVGSQQPVFVESMPNGEAGNRRVEIYFGYN
jgi:outer membrane protein OmpA-like peptidoglycan-associated protein